MRRLGYRTVDMLVDRLTDASIPPLRRATPAEMRARLAGPPPEQAEGFDAVLAQLAEDVLPFASRGDHPGFLAFVPFAGTWPGALGDLVASACNVYAGSWMESAGPSQVELEVLGWFADWIGFPPGSAGILVGGGSAANLTAIACAREAAAGAMRDDLVAYVSDQAHSSLARAARVLGFRPEQLRVLPAGPDFRLRPDVLARALAADRAAGRVPLLVSASGGATNTGAVDPLRELAAVCAEHEVWLHVDAAYGGFAVLTERGRRALDGIELADSVTLDPHKWLYQPYECGCVLVRDGSRLRAAFEIVPDYLHDAVPADGEVNFCDLGVQLTRSARALKLWLSLRTFGVAAFREAIERSLELAARAAERVAASEVLELAAPPSLGVVCFRRRAAGGEDEVARLNAGLAAALERSEIGLVSSTRLHGRYALRLCVLSHTTRAEDVDRVLDFLERAEPEPGPVPPRGDREPDPVSERLRADSTLAALPEQEANLLNEAGTMRKAAAGEVVVEQGSVSRDFFAIAAGEVEVHLEGELARRLGPGQFFGELAALDWGAGFGYARLASVTAVGPLRLLVVPTERFNELVRSLPVFAALVRAAVRERLARR